MTNDQTRANQDLMLRSVGRHFDLTVVLVIGQIRSDFGKKTDVAGNINVSVFCH